ncbi:MAG: insulinase family protein [Clostridia bacterium]|nr:insulinase family protein [Clostridia bacterium]
MEINGLICGFRVVSARESRELGGTLWELEHEKTGAPLYWVDNGEENKLFCVAFKTLPRDDTGVFHILEHSVLCGSDGFPVKEPFLDLLKSSLNTFLNAFTSPDRTSYPVSSRNEKDFMNLTRVYLDAVFRPSLLTNESIFLQEGRRVDFGGEEPCFNGVVFNEMKGATASETRRLLTAADRALYPDNCYGFNSGGEPEAIPELTYDAFLSAYREFYHPSNAIFYLDGDVPFESVLPLIDSYLDAYERDDTLHEIPIQAALPSSRVEETYECGKEEPTENKTHLCFAKLIGKYDERKRIAALEVLQRCWFDSNEAPLKGALLRTGLVKDVNYLVLGSGLQPFAALLLRGTEASCRDALLDALREEVKKLLDDGPDPEDLNAAIDQMELSVRQLDEPQGLRRAFLLMRSRLYGGDPLLYIENESVLRELRSAVGTDYYKSIAEEFFLDETNTAEIMLRPDPEKGATDLAREKEKLNAMLGAMTPEELAAEKEKFDRFKLWQETPDSPEAKRTLPTLTLADVDPRPEADATQTMREDGREILYHGYKTNGVCYFNLNFNIGDLDAADLPALSFVTELLSELPTENLSGALLQRRIKRLFGSFSTNVTPVSNLTGPESTPVYFNVSFSALASKLPEAFDLAREILLGTKFDDRERIKKILTQTKENMQRYIGQAGHRMGAIRALAARNAEFAVRDAVGGVGYYFWLKEFEKEYETRADAFISFASSVTERICTLARLTVSETADEFHPGSFSYLNAFPEGESAGCEEMKITPQKPRREAFIIPGGVSYSAQCATLEELGAPECGDMEALSNILTYDYLWNEIRVRGGAYGCGCFLGQTDGLQMRSYRDPDPSRSLEIYAKTADYIRAFCEGEESVDNYIISASVQPLLEPSDRGRVADQRLLGGVTYELRSQRRKELLGTKKEELESYAALFDKAKECVCFCVIGSREAVEKLGDGWSVAEL